MSNNPISNEQLAELDRLAMSASKGGLASLVDQETYRSELARAYPALCQRLLDAELRLAEAEREIEFLRSAGEAEVNFWVNVIRSLDTENLCDFFDGEGAKEELQRWLAARDAKQRREGAIEALEGIAKDEGIDGGKAYIAKVVYREFPDLMHTSVGVVDASDLMAAAQRLRDGGK